jgi:CubicO group peptidase (beta-lactamase class C family)
MERDATWWTEIAGGVVRAGSGIAATLRDYGRFGLIIADDGRVDGRAIGGRRPEPASTRCAKLLI